MYETSREWNDLPVRVSDDCEELTTDIYERIERASTETIPVMKWCKFYPKLWWNEELKQSKLRRKQLYQQYRWRMSYNSMKTK